MPRERFKANHPSNEKSSLEDKMASTYSVLNKDVLSALVAVLQDLVDLLVDGFRSLWTQVTHFYQRRRRVVSGEVSQSNLENSLLAANVFTSSQFYLWLIYRNGSA